MLAKRIIPCLDIKDGRTVKGINFKGLKDAGCAIELAKKYEELMADELVFLDITATIEGRKTFKELVKKISKEISIPFTVGGGISSIADVEILLENGADKISINSSAVKNPNLVSDLASEFGSQCIVVAVDSKHELDGTYKVYINGGNIKTDFNTKEWISECVKRGAGEILLTSINADGTKNGFDLEQLNVMNRNLEVPLIASGGAGSIKDFENLFSKNLADAGLAASIFHFDEVSIPELKRYLKTKNIEVRL